MSPRLLSKRAALVLIACPAIILGWLLGHFSTSAPSSPSDALPPPAKSYEHTLTPEQRKAAIADLENEQARRQAAAQSEATASINAGK